MYTPAPRRTTNGLTSTTQVVSVRNNVEIQNSTLDALARANVLTDGVAARYGETLRADMQKGIVSFKRYRNTPYGGVYRYFGSSGRVITVRQMISPPGYNSLNNQLCWLSDTGFFGNGCVETLSDLALTGSPSTPQGVYNALAMANLRNRAIAEAYSKVNDIQFDVSEALAGLDKTVIMVAELAMKVLRAWQAVRKGNYQVAVGILGLHWAQLRHLKKADVKSFWLELQYGWLPLLGDIYNGVMLVNGFLNPDTSRKEQLTVVRRVSESLWTRPPTVNTTSWLDISAFTEGLGTVEVRYRFRMADATARFLVSLGLFNPFYTIWVNLPFSFVIDWLMPIGTWLNTIQAPFGLQFTSGYVTRRSWGNSVVRASRRNTGVYSKTYESGSTTATAQRMEIRREVLTSWPRAIPYFRFPFSNPTRVLNAVALINTSRLWR